MEMLVEPLDLQTPIAAFNGGLIVEPDMTVIERRVLPEALVRPLVDLMRSFGLSVWLYRGTDWFVPDLNGPHVAREAQTVQVQPHGHVCARRPHRRGRQAGGCERRPRRRDRELRPPHMSSLVTT